ncbi:MAG: RagB/SusD family nutrient uptake outer membrane protein [Flavisolibacter sp.]|nr:RagB/SusD family nutrient uptake outer membrane protein [Flavisolibacter sp.]
MKITFFIESMKIKTNLLSLIVVGVVLTNVCGCKKLIDVKAPVTSTNADNVFNNDANAISVVTSIYAKMSQGSFSFGAITSMSLFPGLSSDEVALISSYTNTSYTECYKNSLNSNTGSSASFWRAAYPLIYIANSVIEGVSDANTLTPTVKKQLLGEARFCRAFLYFYLVNLYGDVPLALGTDWQNNSTIGRAPKEQVWKQIVSDLKDAQELLSQTYLKNDLVTPYLVGEEEKIRPNKWAAAALLARAYLYTNDWVNAEAEATSVINSGLYDTVSINDVFKADSKEAIWQLQPVNVGLNTQDAKFFILPSSGVSNLFPVYLSGNLVSSFEPDDIRGVPGNWVGSVTAGPNTYYYPYKYKVASGAVTEYLMVLRLSEQFLIRAEARAQQENISGALSDLNVIRKRAGLNNNSSADRLSLLNAIMHERQVELFTEWGHRWFDLKRTGTVNSVMATVCAEKGGVWNTNWSLYPIPQTEIDKNSNLHQNMGY